MRFPRGNTSTEVAVLRIFSMKSSFKILTTTQQPAFLVMSCGKITVSQ
jgi:hypothetical protein